jgi:hypothetical protein
VSLFQVDKLFTRVVRWRLLVSLNLEKGGGYSELDLKTEICGVVGCTPCKNKNDKKECNERRTEGSEQDRHSI